MHIGRRNQYFKGDRLFHAEVEIFVPGGTKILGVQILRDSTEKSILNSLHRSNPASFLPLMAVADSLRTKSAKNPLSPSPGK